jgi:hypothetical protein
MEERHQTIISMEQITKNKVCVCLPSPLLNDLSKPYFRSLLLQDYIISWLEEKVEAPRNIEGAC